MNLSPSSEIMHLSFKIFCAITIHRPLNIYVLWKVRHQTWQQAMWFSSNTTHPKVIYILWPTSPSSTFTASNIASSNFCPYGPLLPSSSLYCLLSGSEYSCNPIARYPYDYIMHIKIIHDSLSISIALTLLHLKSPFSSIRASIGSGN